MIYRIKDWEKHFEINRTKEIIHLRWVPIPNKQDGDGYTELVMEHENGPGHYAVWIACVLIASKCDPRGTLLRDGRTPHSAHSIARKSRLPAALIEEALERLLFIGWMEVIEIPQAGAGIPQEPAQKGREGKGREEKDITGKGRGKSHPPTPDNSVSSKDTGSKRRTADQKRSEIWDECLRLADGNEDEAEERLRGFSAFKDHTGARNIKILKGGWLDVTHDKAFAKSVEQQRLSRIIKEAMNA